MLIYIGDGFLNGLPTRDLDAEEIAVLGGEEALLATGLYKKPELDIHSEDEEVKHGHQSVKKH